jgi:hypothetical protein
MMWLWASGICSCPLSFVLLFTILLFPAFQKVIEFLEMKGFVRHLKKFKKVCAKFSVKKLILKLVRKLIKLNFGTILSVK